MSRTGKPHSGPTWPQVDSLPLVSFECQGQDSPLATAATSKGRCECHGWGSPPSSHVRLHKQLGTSKSGSDQCMVLMSGPGQPKPCQHRGNPPNSPKVKGGEAGTTSTSTNQRCSILQSFRFLAKQLSIRLKLQGHIVPDTVKVKVGEAVSLHSSGSPTCCHLRFPSVFHTFSFTCLSSMCYCLCNVSLAW